MRTAKFWIFTIVGIVLLWAGSIYFVNFAAATDLDDIDDAIEEKEEELEETEEELELSKQREYLYRQEGLSLAEKIVALDKDVEQLKKDIAEDEKKLKETGKSVDEKAEELAEQESVFDDTSVLLYKRSRRSLLEILLASESIGDLVHHVGLRRFGVTHLVSRVRDFQSELQKISTQYNDLSEQVVALAAEKKALEKEVVLLENQKITYERMAAEEAARQRQLVGQIRNITAEQEALIQEKMAATQQSTSVGEYGHVQTSLPDPPFSPAFAVASIGYPHRVGMSQYGAYGRAKAGQRYKTILSAYYNAQLVSGYDVPDKIYVDGYGWMSFEGQYLKGIAEMPTSWGNSGGYEALKVQAILARSYALNYTQDGTIPICATQQCQVYNHSKATDSAAKVWHDAVKDTEGQVLVHGGSPIKAFYASTAGGYTRLPADFDVWGSAGSNLPYLKRIIDVGSDGKAYDGPGHGDSPWYYKVWYADSDVHPWLKEAEVRDLLNAALLPESYNDKLSGSKKLTPEEVVEALNKEGIAPISKVNSVKVINSNEGYTATLRIGTPGGARDVNGVRFWTVYKLRSRGHLALWSSLYDVIVR